MMIDRVGLSPVLSENKVGRNDQIRGGNRSDSVSLSAEALERAEVYQAVELIKATELVDEARIAALREKINDPSYINGAIAATADNVMSAFGL